MISDVLSYNPFCYVMSGVLLYDVRCFWVDRKCYIGENKYETSCKSKISIFGIEANLM